MAICHIYLCVYHYNIPIRMSVSETNDQSVHCTVVHDVWAGGLMKGSDQHKSAMKYPS